VEEENASLSNQTPALGEPKHLKLIAINYQLHQLHSSIK
jgi:hypothetical protein